MASFFHAPAFHDTKPRYDMHTFKGRSWHFYRACNPILMLENDDTIQQHRDRIRAWRRAGGPGGSYFSSLGAHDAADQDKANRALWYSRSVIEGCVHPVTGLPIFPLFRFAAFAPLNLVIVPLSLAPSTIASKGRTLAVHGTNQTLNALVNYYNRASDEVSMWKLAAAYTAAVTTSCGFGLGASHLIGKLPKDSFKATLVRATLPFAAVCTAGIANISLMRYDEWVINGIEIKAAPGPPGTPENDDNAGESMGMSLAAGRSGLAYCGLSRVMLNVNVMMAAPLIMAAAAARSAFVRRYPRQLEVLLLCTAVMTAVPPTLAMIPPVVTVPVSSVEEKYQNYIDNHGRKVEYVTFYKGL